MADKLINANTGDARITERDWRHFYPGPERDLSNFETSDLLFLILLKLTDMQHRLDAIVPVQATAANDEI